MSKRLAIAVVACACVAVAFGVARKIKSFTPTSFERILAPDADGMAILNYVVGQDKTSIQLILSDFSPNTGYDVILVRTGASLVQIAGAETPNFSGDDTWEVSPSDLASFTDNLNTGELTTDDKGRLTFHLKFGGVPISDFSDTNVLIFKSPITRAEDVDFNGTPEDFTDDKWEIDGELRAVGVQNNP